MSLIHEWSVGDRDVVWFPAPNCFEEPAVRKRRDDFDGGLHRRGLADRGAGALLGIARDRASIGVQ